MQTTLGTLLIDESVDNDNSNAMDFTGWRGYADGIAIYGPGTLTSTIKVQVSENGTDWFDLQSNGADITIPADGHVIIKAVTWRYLRVTGTNEAADRTFIVKGIDPVNQG